MGWQKNKRFIAGQRGLLARIEAACSGVDGIIWYHVASFGEFEEARPVIQETRRRYPDAKILLTFFSPSGYEPFKDWPVADWVFYLPLDFPWKVRRFLNAVRPVKAVFTIGEHWVFYLNALRRRKIDTYIMSVYMKEDTKYLKWYYFLFRQIYRKCYTHVITQDERTVGIVRKLGTPVVSCAGDARVERALEIADSEWSNELIEGWLAGEKAFVAGSTTHLQDDEMISSLVNSHPQDKFIIVPHEPSREMVERITKMLKVKSCCLSEGAIPADAKVVIVDSVGSLSRLYRYGFASYVGSGFVGDCVHSVVEPAAYGQPVSFGPLYGRSVHAINMVECGACFSFPEPASFCAWYDRLKSDAAFLAQASKAAYDYCQSGRGSTDRIMEIIFG